MADITPDQASVLRSFLLSTYRHEAQTTARVFAAIPDNQSGFRPDPVSKPAMDLAWHTATVELSFVQGIVSGDFSSPVKAQPELASTGQALASWYSSQAASIADKVDQLTPEQLCKILDFHGVFQMPAVHFLSITTRHTVHHRGQLSTYLRLMGAEVPAIYGESHDSALKKRQNSNS